MPLKVRFKDATIHGLVLAKVGNPQRNEPLQMSRELFRVQAKDQATLTALFLKPFRNLMGQRFHHHSSLDQHEMNSLAKSIFGDRQELLAHGCDMAKRLYSKSNHPNIKAGDLCVALVDNVQVEGEMVEAVCILKSESVTPFLSITTRDGDLQLATEEGINPEKIDKGCLILNYNRDQGFYVLTFDRSGAETRFWLRDFLGVQVVPDAAFLTGAYASMAAGFIEQQLPKESTLPEESCRAAKEAMNYFEERETFDLRDFEKTVLKTPEAVEKFAEYRGQVEEEEGLAFDTSFEISKKDVKKAQRRIGAVMRLDTGVEIHLKSNLAADQDGLLERGFDERKQMQFIKIFHHGDPEVR